MGIRIQPREIDVPEGKPFKNDLLARKRPVEILTRLFGSIEGPCALALDATWGNGKTTFLEMWSQRLHAQVVEFNARETNFCGAPLVALSTALRKGLHEYADEPLVTKITETKKVANEVLRQAVPDVLDHVNNARKGLYSESKEIEFSYVVQLIELLSADFIDEPATEHKDS